MTVTVYRSSDAGAPQNTNTPGDIVAIMKACLVTGYGSKAGAGWSNPYNNGATVAVFLQGSGSNGRYLRLDDSMPSATSPWACLINAYESMSAHSTGLAPFPTAGMTSSAQIVRVAATGVQAAREWTLIATEKAFYFINSTQATSNIYPQCFFFGDFISNVAGDQYNTVVVSQVAGNVLTTAQNMIVLGTSLYSGTAGHAMCRRYDQLGASFNCTFATDTAKCNATTNMGAGGMTYPHPADGGLYLAPVYCGELIGGVTSVFRGLIPGIWVPCHNVAGMFSLHDTLVGSGPLAGKTFEFFNTGNGVANGFFLETSNTW